MSTPVSLSHALPSYILLALFVVITTPPTIFFVLLIRQALSRPLRRKTATVLVLGDIGRSPRMMYHAESLAKHDWETYVIGYGETAPISSLIGSSNVHLLHLAVPPSTLGRLPWVARAPIRVLYQIYSVIQLSVWTMPINTEILLVQNPPSIPTLALAQMISAVSGSKLIIDWHNTGYSILAMRVGTSSPLTTIARWFESTFGRQAFAHLFVTRALEEYLVREWHLSGRSAVLHDRPPPSFQRTNPAQQHELFHRLLPLLSPALPSFVPMTDPDSTPLTRISSSITPVLRSDRPALVVSSTSWTADEDFSLLITALDNYQRAVSSGEEGLPKLVVIITGLGGLRKAFEQTVSQRESSTWKDVTVRCVFLPANDYPILLGCADLGVSLHCSSSGRDLPMKVVDMFGCGVPVLARKFECIAELVKNGRNGRVFEDGSQMGEQMIDLLRSFPSSIKLDSLRAYFDRQASSVSSPGGAAGGKTDMGVDNEWSTWEENWDRVVYHGLLQHP